MLCARCDSSVNAGTLHPFILCTHSCLDFVKIVWKLNTDGTIPGFAVSWRMLWIYACVRVQSCPTLRNPTDCSLPGSSVHGILQARILEWVAMPSSRGSSLPRDRTQVSYTDSLPLVPPGKPCEFVGGKNLGYTGPPKFTLNSLNFLLPFFSDLSGLFTSCVSNPASVLHPIGPFGMRFYL